MPSADYDKLVERFCRAVRQRSRDHRTAVKALATVGVPSVIVAILRQELDSMVRVIYLLSVEDRQVREALLRDTEAGNPWKLPPPSSGATRVSDRTMVIKARAVDGEWVTLLYNFGCSFIHLSSRHDNFARDPFRALPEGERRNLVRLVNQHWGSGTLSESSEFGELAKLLPNIRGKVSGKLEEYLHELESDGDLAEPLLVG